MIQREKYLNKLIAFKEINAIKVITGIRRSGKSVLLKQYMEYLKGIGIPKENIIYINFEYLDFENLQDFKSLYNYIIEKTISGKMYVLIDEIQEVINFEKVIDSLFAQDGKYDIYITGSNSRLLSTEISTLLSGRYVELSILPFSFSEFLEITKLDKKEGFNEYFKYGGLPYVCQIKDIDSKLAYLEGIYNTIVVKDIFERKKITDVNLLKDILKYVLDTVGNYVSAKKIADTLTSNGRKTNHITVSNYLCALEEAFIIYKVDRYDIRGKQRLISMQKYYTVDQGFRSFVLHDKKYNVGSILENIVFLELIRRGYKVEIGKIDNLEIDFIAYNATEKLYIQVSASVVDVNVFQREIKPLLKINDNYKKILLTLDEFPMNYDGISQINIIDWLLNI